MIIVHDSQGLDGERVHFAHEQAYDIIQIREGRPGVRVKAQIVLDLVPLNPRPALVYEAANHGRDLTPLVLQRQRIDVVVHVLAYLHHGVGHNYVVTVVDRTLEEGTRDRLAHLKFV